MAWRNDPIENVPAGRYVGYGLNERPVLPKAEKSIIRPVRIGGCFGRWWSWVRSEFTMSPESGWKRFSGIFFRSTTSLCKPLISVWRSPSCAIRCDRSHVGEALALVFLGLLGSPFIVRTGTAGDHAQPSKRVGRQFNPRLPREWSRGQVTYLGRTLPSPTSGGAYPSQDRGDGTITAG